MLAYTRGSHNIRTGFDMRQAGDRPAGGRTTPRGLFTFNGDMTGYSVADFMLGVPRNGHHARRPDPGTRRRLAQRVLRQRRLAGRREDLTLSLGLRYELNTPVQTYPGYASMLDADLDDDHPVARADSPSPGFEFHEPNHTDFAPRVGRHLPAGREDVLRAGSGIYYNPNQMNSFTFLTNNPPLAARDHVHLDPNNPTLSFEQPDRRRGTGTPART